MFQTNQPPKEVTCGKCGGQGFEYTILGSANACLTCSGTGKVKVFKPFDTKKS